jgi:hypothetical protein
MWIHKCRKTQQDKQNKGLLIIPPQGHGDSYVSWCSPFHNKKKLAQPYEGNLMNVELSFGAFSKVQEGVQGDVDASNTNK